VKLRDCDVEMVSAVDIVLVCVAGSWRRIHNEELHNLYASHNVITVIKRKMRWVGHVKRM
jgi:hypothetical protein